MADRKTARSPLRLTGSAQFNGKIDIVNATMPPQLAQNILPYLTQLDRLNPAQQAAAAHFGRFPSGELGPRRKPVQMAAATPAPTPAPVSAPVDARRSASVVGGVPCV